MSSAYNGNAGLATGSTVTMTQPDDGDALNAASSNVGSSRLADWAQRIANIALNIASTAWTFTVLQTFNGGLTSKGLGSGDNGVLGRGGLGTTIGVPSGASANCGGVFTGSGAGNGVVGISAQNAGSYGGVFEGSDGASAGGVLGTGKSSGLGGYFRSSAANIDVTKSDGYIDISGATNPTSTTGFANRITPVNVMKMWAIFQLNTSAAPSVVDGFNIGAIVADGSKVTVAFATALAGGAIPNVNVTINGAAFPGAITIPTEFGSDNTQVGVKFKDAATGADVAPNGAGLNNCRVYVQVFGRQ